ncbi:unnamed protein product [Pedinophyceae sp. YPF-701]|nr:unnamed protein product [Pedinophyceae sp. YPF-701]
MASQLEIEATDVIKIILQFCKENNLHDSFDAIQRECQVSLNTVDNIEQFVTDITHGRWDAVLPQIATLKLPTDKLVALYEQIVLELAEVREVDTARAMLRQTRVFEALKRDDPERYLKLERLCMQEHPDLRDLYAGRSKSKRRTAIAQALSQEVTVVPPSRLVALIGQALRWQQHQGTLPPGVAYDLFRGAAATARDEGEAPVKEQEMEIKLGGKKNHPECAAFSPDGQALATGSADGFIELWDPATGKLRKNLSYQKEGAFMLHDAAVLCLAWSKDSEVLASGSSDGQIKVWRVSAGQCLRRFDGAHTQGVTSVALSWDKSHVLSGSFDGTARVHGLRSGKMLKEFRGHTSYVNSVAYCGDGGQVLTGSSDGTVRLWDAKSCDCVRSFRPARAEGSGELPINAAIPVPGISDLVVVCDRSSTAHVMNLEGMVVRALPARREGSSVKVKDFVACAVSPRGGLAYCLTEDGFVYCFELGGGSLEGSFNAHDGGAIGLCHHPHRNVVATWATAGLLRTFRS